MEKMFNNESPVIFGNGEHIRDYIHVDDVVRVNCQCLREDFIHVIINVGTGVMTTTNDIFYEINKLFDLKFKMQHGQPQNGEIKVNYLDVSAITQKEYLSPKIKLKDGILDTFKKYKEINANKG